MQPSPLTISEKKFRALSAAAHHRLLAQLARAHSHNVSPDDLLRRYELLHQWVSLDRYQPPPWLGTAEILEELYFFHQQRSGKGEPLEEMARVSWQPRVAVEVVLEVVRSPYNVGSILRLIDNFGLEGLVHSNTSLSLDHPQLVKAARGAQAWIPVQAIADLPTWLAQRGRTLVAVEEGADAISLYDWEPVNDACLILGNETYGISAAVRQMCHQKVCIPTVGFKRSMNVSHAFAVVAQRLLEKQGG